MANWLASTSVGERGLRVRRSESSAAWSHVVDRCSSVVVGLGVGPRVVVPGPPTFKACHAQHRDTFRVQMRASRAVVPE